VSVTISCPKPPPVGHSVSAGTDFHVDGTYDGRDNSVTCRLMIPGTVGHAGTYVDGATVLNSNAGTWRSHFAGVSTGSNRAVMAFGDSGSTSGYIPMTISADATDPCPY
jgi:hypothetical protein